MRRLLLIFTVFTFATAPALAVSTVSFSSYDGGWSYDDKSGILSFDPIIDVDRGLGSPTDALVGAEVVLPDLVVSGADGSYTVSPVVPATIEIQNLDSTPVQYFYGTVLDGVMDTLGSTATLYWTITSDVSPYAVTSAGQALGSDALDHIHAASQANPPLGLDLSITLDWDYSFEDLFDDGTNAAEASDVLSGKLAVIPAPGALILGSLGAGLVGWMRRRRSL